MGDVDHDPGLMTRSGECENPEGKSSAHPHADGGVALERTSGGDLPEGPEAAHVDQVGGVSRVVGGYAVAVVSGVVEYNVEGGAAARVRDAPWP